MLNNAERHRIQGLSVWQSLSSEGRGQGGQRGRCVGEGWGEMEDGVGQRGARQQETEGQVEVCYPGHKGPGGDRPKPLHEDAHLHGFIPKGV